MRIVEQNGNSFVVRSHAGTASRFNSLGRNVPHSSSPPSRSRGFQRNANQHRDLPHIDDRKDSVGLGLVVVNLVIATLGAVLLIGAYRAVTTYLRHRQERAVNFTLACLKRFRSHLLKA